MVSRTLLWVLLLTGVASRTATDDLKAVVSTFQLHFERLERVPNLAEVVELTFKAARARLQCDTWTDACKQCFQESDFWNVLDANSDNVKAKQATEEDLEKLSCFVVGRLVLLREGCRTKNVTDCPALENLLLLKDVSTDEDFHDKANILLRQLMAVEKPEGQEIFSAENLTEALQEQDEKVTVKTSVLARLIIVNFLLEKRRPSVEGAVSEFLHDIFSQYTENETSHLTKDKFHELLMDLKRGSPGTLREHSDHSHSHDHSHGDRVIFLSRDNGQEEVEANHADDRSKVQNTNVRPAGNDEGVAREVIPIHQEPGDHHGHEPGDESKIREEHFGISSTADVLAGGGFPNDNHGHHRHKRRVRRHAEEKNNHTAAFEKCLDANQMLEHFGFLIKGHVTEEEFIELCPALVQQVVSGACSSPDVVTTPRKASNWELYGYSTIAVLIISLMSLVVVVILPFFGKNIYQYLMMCMIGLAFGTMAGDALLHLVPQGLGLHSHGDEDSHDHETEEIPQYLWRQLGILAAIYGIFLFEAVMEAVTGAGQGSSHSHEGHGHSHMADPSTVFNGKSKPVSEKSISNVELTSWNQSSLIEAGLEDKPTEEEPMFRSPVLCWGMRSMAWVITLGDTIHNLGDGLAIGAAFSASTQSGISTSIAVLCHELPHEFGDFVVLLSTGLTFKKALMVNFLSAMSCFIGLYIGLTVGSDENTRLWIMIVTAGIFLYVALTEMLPELKQNTGSNKFAMFLVKNVGILLGVGAMVVIAIYEDQLKFT